MTTQNLLLQQNTVNILQLLLSKGDVARTSDNKLKPKNTMKNCELVLSNDPNLAGCFRMNVFAHKWEIVKPLPWGNHENPFQIRDWTDADDNELVSYMEQFQLTHCKQVILDSLSNIFNRNQYHPVKEYLESLVWDGTQRIDTFLQDVFQVDDNVYTREAFRLFLIAGISRIYKPGCKYDYVLILKGNQGIGKSTVFRILAKLASWHLEDLKNVGKPGIEQIQGKWIAEISELSVMKKTQVEDFKSFITITSDNVRLPYAKRPCDLPRQCIFAGTTNDATYLKDKTGNRRFMPIESPRAENDCIDFEYVESIVDQLWAEAMELCKAGYKLDLSDKAKSIANEYRDAVMDEDIWGGMIEHYLSPTNWGNAERKRVCVKELWDEVVGISNRQMSDDEKKNIRTIMDKMPGWEIYSNSKDHRANCGKYGKQVCWERKDND